MVHGSTAHRANASGRFQAKLGQLCRVLKDRLEGNRSQGAVFQIEGAAQQAGLALDFVFNVIESRAIELCLHRRGAQWDKGGRGSVMCIPNDFGLDL
jgi:hypothetical protein